MCYGQVTFEHAGVSAETRAQRPGRGAGKRSGHAQPGVLALAAFWTGADRRCILRRRPRFPHSAIACASRHVGAPPALRRWVSTGEARCCRTSSGRGVDRARFAAARLLPARAAGVAMTAPACNFSVPSDVTQYTSEHAARGRASCDALKQKLERQSHGVNLARPRRVLGYRKGRCTCSASRGPAGATPVLRR